MHFENSITQFLILLQSEFAYFLDSCLKMLSIVLLFIAQSLLDAGSGDAWKTLKNSDMSSDMFFSLGRSRAIAGSGRIAMKKMRQRKQAEPTVSAFEKNYETIGKPISMNFRMMYAASERSFVSNVGVRRSFRFSRITMLGVAKRIYWYRSSKLSAVMPSPSCSDVFMSL